LVIEDLRICDCDAASWNREATELGPVVAARAITATTSRQRSAIANQQITQSQSNQDRKSTIANGEMQKEPAYLAGSSCGEPN
jgi:hypothetical protein